MQSNKKNKKRFSIRNNIFISMAILVLVMLGIVWLTQIVFMKSFYGYVKRAGANRASTKIVENVDSDDLENLAYNLSLKYESCITVIDCGTGDIVNTKYANAICDEHAFSDCILHTSSVDRLLEYWYNQAKNNDGKYVEAEQERPSLDVSDTDSTVTNNASKTCFVSVKLATAQNGRQYMVVINSAVKPAGATLRTLRLQLVIVSAIVIIVSIIMSGLLSKKISDPVVNISKAAKNLTLSNYNVTFPETGTEETAELAKTLNYAVSELAKIDELQKELIANISHDLRTPLTMISGYSEVMRDIPGENTPENMQVIIDETARLSSLINDMLDVSKLQSGAMPINLAVINLTDLIRKVLKRYEKLVLHDGYKISFEFDYDVFVEADEIRLLQVIYNLLNNAINYTGDDKFVFVYQSIIGDTVRISIRDTGDGISEEDLPHIWDRFYKVDKVHKRAQVGTGLGLSIVKNVLILHGSRFGVSSDVGKGSTFWFEFKTVEK